MPHIIVNDKNGREVWLDQDSINELYSKLSDTDSILMLMLAKAAIASQLQVMTEMYNEADSDVSPFGNINVREATSDYVGDFFVELSVAIKAQIKEVKFDANVKCVRSIETKLVFE